MFTQEELARKYEKYLERNKMYMRKYRQRQKEKMGEEAYNAEIREYAREYRLRKKAERDARRLHTDTKKP